MQSQIQKRFNVKTSQLAAQFFRITKTTPTVISVSLFNEICLHLNPLAQLPTVPELHFNLNSREKDLTPCMLCGAEYPLRNNQILRLEGSDAALFLTAAVLIGDKTTAMAKRAMVQDKMIMCSSHVSAMHEAMLEELNLTFEQVLAGEHMKVREDLMLNGKFIYNKLINMRKLFLDEHISLVNRSDYLLRIGMWLGAGAFGKYRSTRQKPRSEGMPAERGSPLSTSLQEPFETNQEPEEHVEPEMETLASDLVPAVDEFLRTIHEPEVHQEPGTSAEEASPVEEKQVKIEEPDYCEEPTTSVAPAPAVSKKPKIYTLKNGKKVVKAPFVAALVARKSIGGQLVTHRVITKRIMEERRAVEAPAIKRAEYMPSMGFEEKKPETMPFDGNPVMAASSLAALLT